MEIFNYLQTIGSDWSLESSVSSWTVDSDGRGSRERYKSFEDIPASPRVRSRRVSFDNDNALSGSFALSVLKDTYKGFDSPDISPQIKKLRKNFSVHDSLQDFKMALNVNEEDKAEDSRRDGESTELNSQPMYRSISITPVSEDEAKEQKQNPRQRKIGIPLHRNLSFEGLKKPGVNLRKEILKQTLPDFRSCGDLFPNNRKVRHDSAESLTKVPLELTRFNSYQERPGSPNIANIRRFKKDFSFSPSGARDASIAAGVDRLSDAKQNISTNTSNVVELSSHCDCRICREDDGTDSRSSVWRRIFCKLFIKTVSNNQERKPYWDENNNLDEGEMYKCVMHTLKLLFGLWLRHFDHN